MWLRINEGKFGITAKKKKKKSLLTSVIKKNKFICSPLFLLYSWIWYGIGFSSSSNGRLPCLLGHVHLVGSRQLVQMGLQHGLHLVPRRRGEGGRRLLAEGDGGRGGGHPADGRGGHPLLLFLQLVLHALVEVRLHRHRRTPAVAFVSGRWISDLNKQ